MLFTSAPLKGAGLQNVTVLGDVTTTKGNYKINTVIPIDAVSMDVEAPKLQNAGKEMKLSVEENSEIGTEIGQINVVENDGGDLFFGIIGDVSQLIEVNGNGKILVKKNIDYENVKEILFFVNVSNALEKFTVLPVSFSEPRNRG